jgi:hypothetical protein
MDRSNRSCPHWLCAVAAIALAGCRSREALTAERRAVAERVAQDTAARAWRHAVGVDSVRMRADTAEVWVSPRGWMATDAPQAGVRVAPDGRVAAVQWILGG